MEKTMLERFLAWADSRHFVSVRAFTLYATVWMTYQITVQAWHFAQISTFDGVGTAAVIGAVTAPFAALQGFVFNAYMKGK